MAQFNLRDFKKQASFYLREKLNDARLALTDVSRIQLLTEEATNEDPWGPETRTMATLADAAFELEEYDRIVHVIHNRLDGGKQRPWRLLYKTLVVLEYLFTHGPTSIGKEFRGDIFWIEELSQFNFTDQQGIDRGSMVRKIADRVLELLHNPDLWKEERTRARKLSFGIRGFGSNVNQASLQGQEGSNAEESISLSSNKLSKQLAGTYTSMSCQPKQAGFANSILEQHISVRKSISSLGYLKDRSPQLSWQPVAHEDCVVDAEEVSSCLFDGAEESDNQPQQGLQGEGTELSCRLVIC